MGITHRDCTAYRTPAALIPDSEETTRPSPQPHGNATAPTADKRESTAQHCYRTAIAPHSTATAPRSSPLARAAAQNCRRGRACGASCGLVGGACGVGWSVEGIPDECVTERILVAATRNFGH